MKNWIKNIFNGKGKELEDFDYYEECDDKSKKFLVKKIIYEEIVDEDKLKEIREQFIKDIPPVQYAKRDGMAHIAFQPEPPYKLEIQELI